MLFILTNLIILRLKNPETINKVYVRGPPEPAIHRCVRLHHGDPYTKLGPFKLEVRVVNGTLLGLSQ